MADTLEVEAQPTQEEREEIARKVREWLTSEEGQASMKKSLEQAEETVKKLREARRIKRRFYFDL